MDEVYKCERFPWVRSFGILFCGVVNKYSNIGSLEEIAIGYVRMIICIDKCKEVISWDDRLSFSGRASLSMMKTNPSVS